MDDFYYKKLKAYQAVHYYTVKAVLKAIDELRNSISDPQNESVKEHLKQREQELLNVLEVLDL